MTISFENMNLDSKLLSAIQGLGFSTPTEIQKRAIPLILEGKDLLATAETGSGKTAAFVLPALKRLLTPSQNSGRGPRVLILAPTRELVDQIAEATRKFCAKGVQIKFGTIIGGVSYFHQEQLLRKNLDLLIATPGRLLDHMDKDRVDFSRLELFILDEADRMLDMGFRKDIDVLCNVIAEQKPASKSMHQTLLFSATLDEDINRIAKQLLKNPIQLELAQKTKPHANIAQQIHQVDDYKHKCALMFHILENPKVWQAIVFTKTKRGAEKLADEIKSKQISVAHLHGDMKQGQRTRTIDRMHRGDLRVLVATDVAGRGLDIKKLSHVLNFDLPSSVEDYIHRIGRTGRSGEVGTAISLVDREGWQLISRIEKVTGQRLERIVVEGLEPSVPESKFSRNAKNGNGRSFSRHGNGKRPPERSFKQRFGQSQNRDSQNRDRRAGEYRDRAKEGVQGRREKDKCIEKHEKYEKHEKHEKHKFISKGPNAQKKPSYKSNNSKEGFKESKRFKEKETYSNPKKEGYKNSYKDRYGDNNVKKDKKPRFRSLAKA